MFAIPRAPVWLLALLPILAWSPGAHDESTKKTHFDSVCMRTEPGKASVPSAHRKPSSLRPGAASQEPLLARELFPLRQVLQAAGLGVLQRPR